jgi:hypothetical protein
MSQIQSSNHELIELLGLIVFTEGPHPTRDAEAKERELHSEFATQQRFKPYSRGAEWFTSTPQLLSRIAELYSPPEKYGLPRIVSFKIP